MDVHHCIHTDGLMPWEEPEDTMITVCRGCHNFIHGAGPDPIAPKTPGKPTTREEAKRLFAEMRTAIG